MRGGKRVLNGMQQCIVGGQPLTGPMFPVEILCTPRQKAKQRQDNRGCRRVMTECEFTKSCLQQPPPLPLFKFLIALPLLTWRSAVFSDDNLLYSLVPHCWVGWRSYKVSHFINLELRRITYTEEIKFKKAKKDQSRGEGGLAKDQIPNNIFCHPSC